MKRFTGMAMMAVLMASADSASAQSFRNHSPIANRSQGAPVVPPTPATRDGVRVGDLFTYRMSGHPDRNMVVVGWDPRQTDGKQVLVQDLSTGQRYRLAYAVAETLTRQHREGRALTVSPRAPANSPASRASPPPRSSTRPASIPKVAVPRVPVADSPITHERRLPLPVRAVSTDSPAIAQLIAREIQPYASELENALRPSVREWAATCLVESRHGWRAEVKSLLVRAAITDPATSVRAHCIDLLSQLGYHELEYVEYLEQAATSDKADLQKAARRALDKLQPR